MKAMHTYDEIELKLAEMDQIAAGFDFSLLDDIYSDLHSRGCPTSKEALNDWLKTHEKTIDSFHNSGMSVLESIELARKLG